MRRVSMVRSMVGVLTWCVAWVASAPGQPLGFRSIDEAESVAARIMDASGLRSDFVFVVDEGSDNAAAAIGALCPGCEPRRIIIYDPFLLLEIEQQTDAWGPISVMAHEVAHHLLGHSVFGEGSNPPAELDADFYSGFILNRMGASLEQAQAAMRLVAPAAGSSSHPPRRERLEAIAIGWRSAGQGVTASADQALAEMQEELRQLERRLREAEERVRRTEAERDAALEELRRLESQGTVADERRRDAEIQVRESEERFQQAEVARDEAVAELDRFRNQTEVTANRALLLASLLVPFVLAALLLALRKPRREVIRVMERASSVFKRRRVGAPVRGSDGSIEELHRAPLGSLGAGAPAASSDGARLRRLREAGGFASGRDGAPAAPRVDADDGLPARPFDGSGLERCAEPGGFVLGRDAWLVDAVLSHRSVSRRHARLIRHENQLCVEDLNSTNGTRVNGQRIEPFVPQVIAHGDTVTLGDVDVLL